MSHSTTKPTKWPVRPAVSLGIRPVWSESSLCTQWVAKDPSLLHADSEKNQTGRMLIWVFAGHTGHFVGFIMLRRKCAIFLKNKRAVKSCPCMFYLSLPKWYRKIPKNLDSRKFLCNHSKIWTRWLYHRVMHPKDADRMANSVDPDQTAPQPDPGQNCLPTAFCPKTLEPGHKKMCHVCEQQRRRSACASAQSDQRLCCSLLR